MDLLQETSEVQTDKIITKTNHSETKSHKSIKHKKRNKAKHLLSSQKLKLKKQRLQLKSKLNLILELKLKLKLNPKKKKLLKNKEKSFLKLIFTTKNQTPKSHFIMKLRKKQKEL